MTATATKRCSRCGASKPLPAFAARSKGSADGRTSACRSCLKEAREATKLAETPQSSRAGFRVCKTCGDEKPDSRLFFVRSSAGGLQNHCRLCFQTRRAQRMKPAQTKIACTICGETKDADQFRVINARTGRRRQQCGACLAEAEARRRAAMTSDELRRSRDKRNRDRKRHADRTRHWENRDERLAYLRDYQAALAEDPDWAETERARNRARAKRDKHKWAAQRAKRRAALLDRTPPWLTEQHWAQIAAVYGEARRLTAETGVEHHVDHVVPLLGRTVYGLHAPWNLKVIPGEENRRKSAKLMDNGLVGLAVPGDRAPVKT